MPQTLTWESKHNQREGMSYNFEGVTFSLPADFKLIEKEKDSLRFQDENKTTNIFVYPGLTRIDGLMKAARTNHNLYRGLFYSRAGALPLIL